MGKGGDRGTAAQTICHRARRAPAVPCARSAATGAAALTRRGLRRRPGRRSDSYSRSSPFRPPRPMDADLASIQEARDALVAAHAAQKRYATAPQEDVDRIVAAMVEAGADAAERLARMAVEETGFGRVESKIQKNLFATRTLAARMAGLKTAGIIRKTARVWEVATRWASSPRSCRARTRRHGDLQGHPRGQGALRDRDEPAPARGALHPEAVASSPRRRSPPARPRASSTASPTSTLEATDALMGTRSRASSSRPAAGRWCARPTRRASPPTASARATCRPTWTAPPTSTRRPPTSSPASRSTGARSARPSARSSPTRPSAPSCSTRCPRAAATSARRPRRPSCGRSSSPAGASTPTSSGRARAASPRWPASRWPTARQALIAEIDTVGKAEPLSMETLSPILSFYIADGWEAGCARCIEILRVRRHRPHAGAPRHVRPRHRAVRALQARHAHRRQHGRRAGLGRA